MEEKAPMMVPQRYMMSLIGYVRRSENAEKVTSVRNAQSTLIQMRTSIT